MKKIINLKILALAMVFLTGSCEKALEEKPYSFISPEQMEDSPEAMNLWMNGVRSTFLRDGFFRYEVFNRPYEMDCDDITGNRSFYNQTGSGNFGNADDLRGYWSSLYLLIGRSNYVIPSLNSMSNVERDEIDNAIGELNFYKAWAYFTLVRAFGPVPLSKTSVVYGEPANLPRSSVAEVYAYIIEILKESEAQLFARTNAKYKVGMISQEAAKTMLAKVYLNMASGGLSGAQLTVMGGPHKNAAGQRLTSIPLQVTKDVVAGHESFNAAEYFRLARDKAKEVIDVADPGLISVAGAKVGLINNWNNLWSKASRGKAEHLWMLYSEQGKDNNGMVLTYHYCGQYDAEGRMLAGSGPMGLSDHWYDLFEETDRRIRDGVIHKFTMNNNAKRWYPAKEQTPTTSPDPETLNLYKTKYGYDDPSFRHASGDQGIARVTKYLDVTDKTLRRTDAPYPFLRYAETLLIYAEAANEVDDITEAVSKLNQVRFRSEATPVEPGDFDKVSLRSFILEERRRELALEGNRPWDLRRWGIYLQVMNAIGNDNNNIVKSREQKHLLFALPIVEITGNTEINENNPGW